MTVEVWFDIHHECSRNNLTNFLAIHQCALAKLSYLLSKPELSPAQIRSLLLRPLRGELTVISPVPTFASPLSEVGDRVRTLFTQLMECSPSAQQNPLRRGRSKSSVDSTFPHHEDVPSDFDSPWPATARDADNAEKALLPYLLGQAASRSGPLLAEILNSLTATSAIPATALLSAASSGTAISFLSEPSTPSLQTPLHLAVLASQPINVALLLSHGASVHSRDILCHSALFYAARLGTEGKEMVELLKKCGAHLGEVELERGEVGMEIARSYKLGKAEDLAVWKSACGDDLERAKDIFRSFTFSTSG